MNSTKQNSSAPTGQTTLQLDERPLREPEATIWRILERDHRGRWHAIKMPDLADMVGLETRALQDAIRYMRLEHGKPIGSTSDRTCPGYFVIIDAADFDKFFFSFLNRGISILAVAYKVKNSDELKNILGQLDTLAGR